MEIFNSVVQKWNFLGVNWVAVVYNHMLLFFLTKNRQTQERNHNAFTEDLNRQGFI